MEFKKGCQSAKTDLMSGTSLGQDILLARTAKEQALKDAVAAYKRTKRDAEKATAATNTISEAVSNMPQSQSTTPSVQTPSPHTPSPSPAISTSTPASSPATLSSPAPHLSPLRSPKTNTTLSSTLDAHHLARDPHTGAPLRAILTRTHFTSNTATRLVLSLYESHLAPHTYAVHLRTASSGTLPRSEILCPVGSGFETAWGVFRRVFEEKTRVSWEERGDAKGVGWSEEYLQGVGGWEALRRLGVVKGEGEGMEGGERVWPFRYVVEMEE